ncbi:hypothetical protein QZH41_018440, partial [Actinostola sp. cb2023]
PARRDQNAARRGMGSLIGTYLLKPINFVAKITTKLTAVVELSLTITQAIKGCVALFPSLGENWKTFKKLDAEFRTISADIDAKNNQATSRQIYANSSFYEYRNTRDKMEGIGAKQERVFKSLGPKVLIALQNTSFEIELEKVLGHKLKVAAGASTNAVKKVTAGKFMKTSFGQRIQRLVSRSQGKFMKAQKLIKGVKIGLGSLLKLGIAAFGVWSIFARVKDCKDAADHAETSVREMKEFVKQNKEMLAKMKDANVQVQQAFDEIREAAWAENLLVALQSIKEMMSDPLVAKKTEDRDSIVKAVQAYIDGKDIDADIDNNKLTLSDLQRNLNAVLHRVPLTLECHRLIGVTFQAVSLECSIGKSSLRQVYDKTRRQIGIDDDTKSGCDQKTGDTFVDFDIIKQAWEKWVSTNTTYKVPCLMNNKFIVESIREQLQNGERDVNTIAQSVNQPDGVDEIQIIIDELLKDPSINDLSKSTQRRICMSKPWITDDMTVEKVLPFLNMGKQRKVTKEEFENQTCPVPEDDVYLSKISNDPEKDDDEDDDEKEE